MSTPKTKTTIIVQHCGPDSNWRDFTHHDADQLAAARKCIANKDNYRNYRIIRRTEEEITPPETVQLLESFNQPSTGVYFPKGTILVRANVGKYAPPGTPYGGKCVGGFDDIQQICQEVDLPDKFREPKDDTLPWDEIKACADKLIALHQQNKNDRTTS